VGGEAGRLAPVEDARAMARAIEELLGNSAEASRLVSNAVAQLDRFLPEVCYSAYSELLSKR
jgi:glycosyltransferase involved in cell wall biosynthesis